MKLLLDIILEERNFGVLENIINTLFNDSRKHITNTEDENKLTNEYNLERLSLSVYKDYLVLDFIKSNKKGSASRALEDLCKYADKYQKVLCLSPTDAYVGKKNLNRLKALYKRFGFAENKGKKSDFQIRYTMYRKPLQ